MVSSYCFANPFELSKGAPIEIIAEKLSLSSNLQVAEYSGNVIVRQGKLKFKANLVKVISSDENKIQKIQAFSKGNQLVTFRSSYVEEPMQATATTILYNLKTQQVELTGNPVEIMHFSNFLSASKIKLNLKTRDMQATGIKNQPAKLRFYQNN